MLPHRFASVQIACEKTRGNTSRALELLQKYVDTFMTDREAWEELGDMYLQVCDFLLVTIILIVCGARKNSSLFAGASI